MKKYVLDVLESPVGEDYSEVDYIVETAGFEPLETKIKRFMLGGMMTKLYAEQFDSNDYQRMFEEIPLVYAELGDDIEDLQAKIQRYNEIKAQIIAEKQGELSTSQPPEQAADEEPQASAVDPVVNSPTQSLEDK